MKLSMCRAFTLRGILMYAENLGNWLKKCKRKSVT